MPGGAPAFMPCLPSCPAHRLFILQSYVFLGAKPNYPAFFALNVRITTMLRPRHRGASGIAGKVIQSMISIVLHNRLIFNALQKAVFCRLKGALLQCERTPFRKRPIFCRLTACRGMGMSYT